jgi:hypothetical protein
MPLRKLILAISATLAFAGTSEAKDHCYQVKYNWGEKVRIELRKPYWYGPEREIVWNVFKVRWIRSVPGDVDEVEGRKYYVLVETRASTAPSTRGWLPRNRIGAERNCFTAYRKRSR